MNKPNPTWIKGCPSPNRRGRPVGRATTRIALQNPNRFFRKRQRWLKFALQLGLAASAAEAARRAGYSVKTARIIACQLRAKPTMQILFSRINTVTSDSQLIREYRERAARGLHGLWW